MRGLRPCSPGHDPGFGPSSRWRGYSVPCRAWRAPWALMARIWGLRARKGRGACRAARDTSRCEEARSIDTFSSAVQRRAKSCHAVSPTAVAFVSSRLPFPIPFPILPIRAPVPPRLPRSPFVWSTNRFAHHRRGSGNHRVSGLIAAIAFRLRALLPGVAMLVPAMRYVRKTLQPGRILLLGIPDNED
jgi:hypothetical protein